LQLYRQPSTLRTWERLMGSWPEKHCKTRNHPEICHRLDIVSSWSCEPLCLQLFSRRILFGYQRTGDRLRCCRLRPCLLGENWCQSSELLLHLLLGLGLHELTCRFGLVCLPGRSCCTSVEQVEDSVAFRLSSLQLEELGPTFFN